MADYRPGDTVYAEFTTQTPSTGAATNADSLPVGTVNRNGADDVAVSVTVTNLDTGRYSVRFAVPTSYNIGDVLAVSIAATLASVAGKGIVWSQRLGMGVPLESGYAQGGSSSSSPGSVNSITLRTGASAKDNYYKDQVVFLLSGTGAGQTNRITSYSGSSKVAVVETPWVGGSAPDGSTQYVVLGRVG